MNELNIHPEYPRFKSYLNRMKKIEDQTKRKQYAENGFASVLRYYAKQFGWKLSEYFPIESRGSIEYIRGAILDRTNLIQGIWICGDEADKKMNEALRKSGDHMILRNTLLQNGERLVLWRKNKKVIDGQLKTPQDGSSILNIFFRSPFQTYAQFDQISKRLETEGPFYIDSWRELIRGQIDSTDEYQAAIEQYRKDIRVYPTLKQQGQESDIYLLQFFILKRLSDKIFRRSAFITNASLSEVLEKVITKLGILRQIPDIILEIEPLIRQIASDLSQEEGIIFLETLLSKFFPLKDSRIKSSYQLCLAERLYARFLIIAVRQLLAQNFNQKISDEEISILQPFHSSGIIISELLKQIDPRNIDKKYRSGIFGHETELINYYVSLLRIEIEFLRIYGRFRPFENLNLIDTMLLSGNQFLDLYPDGSNEVIEQQKKKLFSLIIGHTPEGTEEFYKKRRHNYTYIDKRVFMTYGHASSARNKSVLSDVYVKAIRWASDKIAENKQGIIGFICKNNFIEDLAFDGFRKHLFREFNRVYVLDVTKNENKGVTASAVEEHAVLLLLKKKHLQTCDLFYHKISWQDFIDKVNLQEKLDLDGDFNWRNIKPDRHHTWLTEGLQKGFDSLLPMGTKISKAGKENAIFRIYGRGIATARDAWVYNFKRENLISNIQEMIQVYNKHVQIYANLPKKPEIDDYLRDNDTQIPWSETLKNYLRRQVVIRYQENSVRQALYRPFVTKYLYFDPYLIERSYQIPYMVPYVMSEKENRIICVASPGSKNISVFITNLIPDLNLFAGASPIQCFPLYHYDREKRTKQENISDWALDNFISYYHDKSITKYDIFHYVYGLLHHPDYIRKYAANLRKELPRIPYGQSFHEIAQCGKNLARLHLFWEGQAEYPLRCLSMFEKSQDWQIEKIRFSENQKRVYINDNLSLSNVPSAAFNYLIGQRSALEWLIDQYRLRSPISNGSPDDPNRSDDPTFIARRIGQVITVSLETLKIIQSMPNL